MNDHFRILFSNERVGMRGVGEIALAKAFRSHPRGLRASQSDHLVFAFKEFPDIMPEEAGRSRDEDFHPTTSYAHSADPAQLFEISRKPSKPVGGGIPSSFPTKTGAPRTM